MPHILALEEKTPFKFRFRSYWVPEQYAGILKKWATEGVPLGQPCMIMFRHQATAQFIPVRQCILQEVKLIGEVFYLRVSLGVLPEIESGDTARGQQWDEIQTVHKETLGPAYPNQPGKELQKLVFTTNRDHYLKAFHNTSYAGAAGDRQFGVWDALFLRYSQLPEFKGIDFFKIIGIYTVSPAGRSRNVEITKWGTYRVSAGQRYALRIYQRRADIRGNVSDAPSIDEGGAKSVVAPTSTSSPVYSVKLLVDNEAVRALDGDQPVLGRYDVLEFIFRPVDGGTGQVTFLIVQLMWESVQHSDALKKFRLALEVAPRRFDSALSVIFGVVLFSLFFRAQITTATGFSDHNILNIQTFLLFFLGVAIPSVQRVVQSIASKLFGI